MANRDKIIRRIWNMAETPYKEHFKGEDIEIPAHGFIENGRRWCVEFMGTPTKYEPDFPDNPENIKYLRWEDVVEGEKPVAPIGYACQVCGQKFSSKQQLGGHMGSHKEQPAASKPA